MRSPLERLFSRTLRPLVRLALARRLGFPAFASLLKTLYVEVAEQDFALAGRRMTDSRVSLLTGLQRRDVRSLRAAEAEPPPLRTGPLRRVLARWRAEPWCDQEGEPRVLPRRGPRSFETLVASVSRDLHPRTLLDQLLADGSVAHDVDAGSVTLIRGGPARDEASRLDAGGGGLAAHATVTVANLLGAAPPHYERSVQAEGLSAESVIALERLARNLQAVLLSRLDAEAQRLQAAEKPDAPRTGRFRAGVFFLAETPAPLTEDSGAP